MKKRDWYSLYSTVIASAAGALLYLLVGRLFTLPFILGIQLRPQLLVLVLVAVACGPIEGCAAGLFGEALLGAATGGIWWSLVAGAAMFGFGTSFACRGNEVAQGFFDGIWPRRYLLTTLPVHLAASVVVIPALDMLFYREAFSHILLRGLIDGVANFVLCALLGTLLLKLAARGIDRVLSRRDKRRQRRGRGTSPSYPGEAAQAGSQQYIDNVFDYGDDPFA